MAKYRKKPVVIDAEQWFKNGDHSKDHDPIGIKNPTSQDMERYYDYRSTEGEVVRRYAHHHSTAKRSVNIAVKLCTTTGGLIPLKVATLYAPATG